jgi:hypothetical protein
MTEMRSTSATVLVLMLVLVLVLAYPPHNLHLNLATGPAHSLT